MINSSKRLWLRTCLTLAICSTTSIGQAQTFDFEDCEIGQKFTMWNVDTGNITDNSEATAEVVADPQNPNNKVLHVIVKRWGTFFTLDLPKELAGHLLTDKKTAISFDLYRPASDQDDYKQFHAYLGSDKLYQDNSYPYQGAKGTWVAKSYPLNAVTTADDTDTSLHLGIHHNNTEYYIDNIKLKGAYDDYFVADEEHSLIDICEKNTSSSYKVLQTPILVEEGKSLDIRTSRYTYLNSKIEGKGNINLYAGGERTYLGSNEKNAKNYHPDWSGFAGSLNIYPYKDVEANAGFYGLVWMSGKTFAPDNAEQNALDGNINPCFTHTSITLHNGATMACESGKRGLRIGQLNTEEGSTLYGYLKEKADNDGYYMIGGNDADGILAGRIIPMGGSNLNVKVGIVKEGEGTYRITSNNNLMTGGLRILDGAVMVNNDAEKAKANRLSGGIGYLADNKTETGVLVMKKGLLGGIGNIGCTTDVYGTLAPGDGGIGMLTIANYATNSQPRLILHPKAKIKIEVTDKEHYDKLIVNGNIEYDNRQADFTTSNEKPRIYIQLTSNPTLQVGDELTIINAKEKTGNWDFDIKLPKQYTWNVVERQTDDNGYSVVAIVTAIEYGGQGEWNEDDEDNGNKGHETIIDIEKEKQDATPLAQYAEKMNKYVGTCVSLYNGRINLDDENDSKTKLFADQFNMVVCENEMKFDATEPEQGTFNYYYGDKTVDFAQKHNMRVRGHALVWYSQVASWVSSDGKKNDKNFSASELQDIIKCHIDNVVGHWKGKVAEWDVCNEVLDDDQSVVRTNPTAFKLRSASIWNYAGEDYIEKAFRWAHEADPDAQLILNDYGVEFQGQAKAEAFYNLAKYLKDKGVPIDGVGLQCHLDVGNIDIDRLKATIDRFNAIGLRCVITELDLGMDDNEANRLQQAKDYYNIAKTAMEAANCNEIMVWGLSDDMTWRNNRNPLLYDVSLAPKDAYYGIHIGIREAAENNATGINANNSAKPSNTIVNAIYNISGQRQNSVSKKGVYIVCEKDSNGLYRSRKILSK